MSDILKSMLLLFLSFNLLSFDGLASDAKAERPNIILVFIDDAGYADFSITGSDVPTPNIDALAKNGVQFTEFYSASPVCSASRAALLTGRYPDRFSFKNVLFEYDKTGLPAQEDTLAEMLKGAGYSTHIFGKWHLGHLQGALPLSHGFDEYYGIPYSNDMWQYRRDRNALNTEDEQAYVINPKSKRSPLKLFEGDMVIKAALTPSDLKVLTRNFTDRTIDVINKNSDAPFFIYLPIAQTHIPLFVSDEMLGKSGGTLYDDVIYEIDQSMGRIMAALDARNLTDNTLVIFTSDNGPWALWGDHAGSAGTLRGFKMTSFEGGIKVFAAMQWPAGFESGVKVSEPLMTIDILPTLAEITGAKPSGQKLDGRTMLPFITGDKTTPSEPHAYYNYYQNKLENIRYGKWKLHLPHPYKTLSRKGTKGFRGNYSEQDIDWSLFDLSTDPSETTNVADAYPEIFEELKKMAEEFDAELQKTKTPMGQYE